MNEQKYRFSDATADMDRDRIHFWLSEKSYWALGRPRATLETAMDNSRNFGMFDIATGDQVGYARVITDSATFAWLADVFIDDSVRGRGVGIDLIAGVSAVLEPLNLKRVALVTADAHGLYEKFGFESITDSERWMARVVN
jgi:N-acetylglutamate synthase-like GNAT family acetyltransferase